MLDSRIFAAIILMGLAAAITKGIDLFYWWSERRPLEPVVIDTQSNGGVSSTTGAEAKIRW